MRAGVERLPWMVIQEFVPIASGFAKNNSTVWWMKSDKCFMAIDHGSRPSLGRKFRVPQMGTWRPRLVCRACLQPACFCNLREVIRVKSLLVCFYFILSPFTLSRQCSFWGCSAPTHPVLNPSFPSASPDRRMWAVAGGWGWTAPLFPGAVFPLSACPFHGCALHCRGPQGAFCQN